MAPLVYMAICNVADLVDLYSETFYYSSFHIIVSNLRKILIKSNKSLPKD